MAPLHDATSAFLKELCERITRLNPGIHAQLVRTTGNRPEAVIELVKDAQHAIQDGQHSVLVVDSLNALAGEFRDALKSCKWLFGSAQATTDAGTLTIIALADSPACTDLGHEILKSFRGTGNMELVLRVHETGHAVLLDSERSGTKHSERIRSAQ